MLLLSMFAQVTKLPQCSPTAPGPSGRDLRHVNSDAAVGVESERNGKQPKLLEILESI